MFKLAAVLFAFCIANSLAWNVKSIQNTCNVFQKSFNETDAELWLILKPEDKEFYKNLRNLISNEETATLKQVLLELITSRNQTIEGGFALLRKIEKQLSEIKKLKNVNSIYPIDTRLYENSKLLHSILGKTLDFISEHSFYKLSSQKVAYDHNIYVYSDLDSFLYNLKRLGEQTSSALGKNFTRAFEYSGESKFFKIRDKLVERHRSKRSFGKVIGFWACKFVEFLTSFSNFEKKVAEFIYKNIPYKYQSEFVETLTYKGVEAVITLARMYCGLQQKTAAMFMAHTEDMPLARHQETILDVYSDVFPKRDVDIQFFTSFVYWYRISLQNAEESSEQAINGVLTPVNNEILRLAKELSNAGNDVLTVYNGLKLEQYLKSEIKNQAELLRALIDITPVA